MLNQAYVDAADREVLLDAFTTEYQGLSHAVARAQVVHTHDAARGG